MAMGSWDGDMDGFLTGIVQDLKDEELFNSNFNYSDVMGFAEDPDLVSPPVESNGDDSVPDGSSQLVRSSDCFDSFIPKSLGDIGPPSIAAKMMTALSIFNQSSKSGFLAQVWLPTTIGNEFVLSTYDQPYLLNRILSGYREISRSFIFATRQPSSECLQNTQWTFPGLPGRVFMSRQVEWTSNVRYYSKDEFLRANYASSHQVRGSLAVPVVDPSCDENSCCAVVEIATTSEKNNFHSEIDGLCSSLQVVNLMVPKLRNQQKNLTQSQKSAISEISDVLSIICSEHMLPLALTWIPSDVTNSSRKSSTLQIVESACYIDDQNMNEFLHACGECQLNEGEGTAGKALQSNHPFFCPDVKGYNIIDYPLVHHARRFGLNAAVAIRLRSTHTENDHYVLELFLPVNCNESTEQQLLLNNLSITMQRTCRSLRTVSDEASSLQKQIISDRERNLQTLDAKKHRGKKPVGKEKNTIGLDVLQHYFSGSLKNAAKILGVCPTTLKRICRQHGISRWPSRKIHKVNRSLKKIQTVIDSVESELKYDPASGNIFSTSVITPSNRQYRHEIVDTSFIDPVTNHPRSDDHLVGHNQNESNSHNFSRTTGSFDGSDAGSQPKEHAPAPVDKPTITVKATYRENMVRFSFTPSTGCVLLFEAIARRFELMIGMFQLKYMDDEDDWVTLENDGDLQECIDLLELDRFNCLRIQKRQRFKPPPRGLATVKSKHENSGGGHSIPTI